MPNCAGGSSHEARVKNGPALAGHGAESVRDAITRTIVTLPEQLRRSPLRRQNPRHQNVWPIQRFSTPRIPRSAQNATSNRPSQASALGWPELSPGDCPDAPVAKEPTCDTVRLAGIIARIGKRSDERPHGSNIARHYMSGTVAGFDCRHSASAMGSGSMFTPAHHDCSSP